MSRMSEAQYELIQDCKEKKITARSARNTRTHNGKSGAVKFPSDYLTAKERKKLSGECKSYRMNDPMTFKEFLNLPDDLKVCYIKALRQKYDVPDSYIAEMMGIAKSGLCRVLTDLGLTKGRGYGKRTWKKDEFMAWRTGENVDNVVPAEEENTSLEDNVRKASEILGKEFEAARVKNKGESEWCSESITPLIPVGIAPDNGTLTFEGKANDILLSLQGILQNRYVRLSVQWTTAEAPIIKSPMVNTDELRNAGKIIDYAILNKQRREKLNTKG